MTRPRLLYLVQYHDRPSVQSRWPTQLAAVSPLRSSTCTQATHARAWGPVDEPRAPTRCVQRACRRGGGFCPEAPRARAVSPSATCTPTGTPLHAGTGTGRCVRVPGGGAREGTGISTGPSKVTYHLRWFSRRPSRAPAIVVYCLCCLCCLCSFSSLDTGLPLRLMHGRRDEPGSCRARSPALHVVDETGFWPPRRRDA